MHQRLAVLGSPIEHSKSPELHAAAYTQLGLDWSYTRERVEVADLSLFIAGLDRSWRGLSVTMPLKSRARELMDTVDEGSRLTGGVNTVLCDDRAGERVLRGFNTDIPGIQRAIAAHGVRELHGHADILGAGATAASAAVACARMGLDSIRLVARDPERAYATRDVAVRAGLAVEIVPFENYLPQENSALIVSTLPGGTETDIDFSAALRRDAILFDVAYSPWPSPLARAWTAENGIVVSGLDMLVHQALIQVRIFTGYDPRIALPNEDLVLARMCAAVGLDQPAGDPRGK